MAAAIRAFSASLIAFPAASLARSASRVRFLAIISAFCTLSLSISLSATLPSAVVTANWVFLSAR
jgi:hypothetical protein